MPRSPASCRIARRAGCRAVDRTRVGSGGPLAPRRRRGRALAAAEELRSDHPPGRRRSSTVYLRRSPGRARRRTASRAPSSSRRTTSRGVHRGVPQDPPMSSPTRVACSRRRGPSRTTRRRFTWIRRSNDRRFVRRGPESSPTPLDEVERTRHVLWLQLIIRSVRAEQNK